MTKPSNAPHPAADGPPPGFHRLAPQTSVRGTFITAVLLALAWNGISLFVFTKFFSSSTSETGVPLWVPALFGVVGLGFIYWAIKSFLRWTMTGQTTVDVNMATAIPGEPLEVLVSQPGKYSIDQCTVDLVCQEVATSSVGTDTETTKEIVRTVPVCELTSVTASGGSVLAHQTTSVPPDAMLSFEAPHNKIIWMIRVSMRVAKRPDSEQLFPIRVLSRQVLELEEQS